MNKDGSGYNLEMFYLYVDSVSLGTACAQNRAISQTSNGGLTVHYRGKGWSSFQTWCARWSSHYQLEKNYSIEYHIRLDRSCHSYYRFIFGEFSFFIVHISYT